MESASTTLKVRLTSKLIEFYYDPVASNEWEAEELFEAFDGDILFSGNLSFIPDTVLDETFPIPFQDNWEIWNTPDGISELDLFDDKKSTGEPLDNFVYIELDNIAYKLQEHDWNGYAGEFVYVIEGILSFEVNQEDSPALRDQVSNALKSHCAFYNDEKRNSEDHTSMDMIEFEIDSNRYWFLPIDKVEFI